jgi:hypothetical protein
VFPAAPPAPNRGGRLAGAAVTEGAVRYSVRHREADVFDLDPVAGVFVSPLISTACRRFSLIGLCCFHPSP